MDVKYHMSEVLADKWWLFVVALVVSLIATPIVRAIAYKTGIVDKPDDLLKPHGRPIAYLGGVAICAGLVSGLLCYLAIMPGLAASWATLWPDFLRAQVGDPVLNPLLRFIAIVLSCVIIMLVGLIDDIKVLSPRKKILGQVLAAAILLVGGVANHISRIILSPPIINDPPHWLVLPLSALFCLVLVIATCNAVNLLDGMDGLCGGVTGIITIGFLALAVWLAMWSIYPKTDGLRLAICLSMAGAVIGFLPYNLPPATIFMGDAGSMLLGFFVAIMMILFCREGTARWFVAACVVFALPILDTGLAVVRRLLSHKSIFAGDRSHLYDQLIDRGLKVKQVVALFYVLAAAAAVIGVVVSILLRLREALPIYFLLLIVVVAILLLLGMMTPPPREPHHETKQDPLSTKEDC